MTAFSRFDPRLQEKIVNNLGWTSLRPVQDLTGHAVLDGKNCVVLAPTAGGKTEASIFPVLSGCISEAKDGLRALYVCPTRAPHAPSCVYAGRPVHQGRAQSPRPCLRLG